MKRWLVLTLGLAIAAAGLYALASSQGGSSAPGPRRAPAAPPDEIDADSREALLRVLRDSEEAEGRP